MLPVIVYTLYFYVDWSSLLSPFDLGLYALAGVVIGSLALIVGLPLSSPNPRQFIVYSVQGLKYLTSHKDTIGFQIGITGYEEIIWRVFLISTLLLILPVFLAVAISAILFWTVHEENRPIGWHSLEFFLFSILLGTTYVITQSFIFLWAIHLSRNLLILSASYYKEYNT